MYILMVMEKTTAFGYLIQEHARALLESGHRVDIVFLTGPARPDYRALVPGAQFSFEELPAKALRGLRLTGIFHCRTILRARKPDIVISHQFSAVVCCAVARALSRSTAPLAGVFHGINAGKASSRRLFFRLGGNLITRYVMVSDQQRDNFRHYNPTLPNARFVTLHNIVDADTMRAGLCPRTEARQRLGLDADAKVFGYVGRLNRKKGVYELLDAFERAAQRTPALTLAMIGDGPEAETLSQLIAQRGLNSRVRMLGHIDNAWQLMPAFDFFVLPSYGESFGMVLAEAMVARVPIIATRGGAIPEVMGDAALALCGPQDDAALEQCLTQALQTAPDQLRALTDKGWHRVSEKFSYAGLKRGLSLLVDELSTPQHSD